jgi:uncharacterized protein YbaR (Trm112 family)
VDSALLEILRCPAEHHAVLTYDADKQTLTCTECARVFPIRDGIPVLLLDDTRSGSAGSDDTRSGSAETTGGPATGAGEPA